MSHVASRASNTCYIHKGVYRSDLVHSKLPKGRQIPVRDVFVGALSPSDITLKRCLEEDKSRVTAESTAINSVVFPLTSTLLTLLRTQ